AAPQNQRREEGRVHLLGSLPTHLSCRAGRDSTHPGCARSYSTARRIPEELFCESREAAQTSTIGVRGRHRGSCLAFRARYGVPGASPLVRSQLQEAQAWDICLPARNCQQLPRCLLVGTGSPCCVCLLCPLPFPPVEVRFFRKILIGRA